MSQDSTAIGYLWQGVAVCFDCYTQHCQAGMLLYAINIIPYSQHCGLCGKLMLKGAEGWCELFPVHIHMHNPSQDLLHSEEL